jgi:hypothetical protein
VWASAVETRSNRLLPESFGAAEVQTRSPTESDAGKALSMAHEVLETRAVWRELS